MRHTIILAVLVLSVPLLGLRAQDYAPGRLVVKFEPRIVQPIVAGESCGIASLDEALAALGMRQLRALAPARMDGRHAELRERFGTPGVTALSYSADIDPVDAAEALRGLPGIVYAHPDFYATLDVVPDDPFYVHQYAMRLMSMPAAWDVAQGASDIIIGISDTGTDWDHPDLRGIIWINDAEDLNNNGIFDNFPAATGGDLDSLDADGNGYLDDVIGWDFVTASNVAEGEDSLPPDPDPMDFDGHGTATAGIAGAMTNNGILVAGTSWGCTIMPLKTFYGHPSGNATAVASDIIESFYYAADNGVDVLSMSFRSGASEGLQEAVQYAHAAGVFLVASAGNEGTEAAPTPAGYPEVLAVGATQQQDLKASFSNYGAWVGVSAPGVDIWTTAFDDTYMTDFGGTSASCPYVAGVAGLLLSHNPMLTNTDLYYQLVGTCDEIDGVNPEFRGKLGCGRINGFRALTEAPHPALRLLDVVVDDGEGGNGDGLLGPGETATLSFTVRNYWQDAADAVATVLTNDPHIAVDTSVVITFGGIPTDSVVASTGGVTVNVAPDADIGYHALFTLNVTDGSGYAEHLPFDIPVAAQVMADASADLGISGVTGTLTAVWADFDGDGDADLYRSAWSGSHGLYRNEGDTLIDMTAAVGLPAVGSGQGAAWGDYDNDGYPDLARGTAAGIALFHNEAGQIFTDVTSQAGLISTSPRNFAPVWGDYDGDGRVDLFVAHQQQANQLFHNNGDGTFTDVAGTAGVASDSVSFGASWADFDRDGDLDLFVANYGTVWLGQVNQFYVNQGDGTFRERAAALGLADEELISTGGFWGDYDADGWLDLYVTNKGSSGQPNRLYRNIRGLGFVRHTTAGVEDPRSSSSAAWVDFDGDGWLDLIVANTQRSTLYRNFGGSFGDASESAPLDLNGLVVAPVDVDADGDEDVYLGSPTGDRILKNLSNPSSSLRVYLQGAGGSWGSSRDALGARVTLGTGSHSMTRIVGEGSGWGQGSPFLTMPWLGDPEIVAVEWPSGTIQRAELAGPGVLTLDEARSVTDLALRALALPWPDTHGESRVAVSVAVQDNGSSPLPEGRVILRVHGTEGALVYADSVDVDGEEAGLVTFGDVPAPPPSASYSYEVVGVAGGDEVEWNDLLLGPVTGGEPFEDFELPVFYWELTDGWRWARSSPMHPAAGGEGFLFLEAPQGEQTAVSPWFPVEAGTVAAVRFLASYDLGADSMTVTVSYEGIPRGDLVLKGTEPYYGQQVIEFPVETAGEIQVTWSYDGESGGDPEAFFRMDDFEVVVLASGQPETVPRVFTVTGPWPNPTRGALTWQLTVPRPGPVRMETFDLGGRRVASHALGVLAAGVQQIEANTVGLAPGAYVARFSLGSARCQRPFVRVR